LGANNNNKKANVHHKLVAASMKLFPAFIVPAVSIQSTANRDSYTAEEQKVELLAPTSCSGHLAKAIRNRHVVPTALE
jgi:hypothetical protein